MDTMSTALWKFHGSCASEDSDDDGDDDDGGGSHWTLCMYKVGSDVGCCLNRSATRNVGLRSLLWARKKACQCKVVVHVLKVL